MTDLFVLAAEIPGLNVEVDTLFESAIWAMVIEWGLRILYAGVILVVGLWVAFFLSGAVRNRILKSPHVDPTLGRFFGSITRYLLVAIVMIAVLQKFGVQTTSLVAMLGAATLAIGLALQGTLGDLAAGVMIILFRPYRVGDFVDIGGKSGTVDDISIFYTAMNTIDNRRVIIHNGKAWGDVIENYSFNATRRLDMTYGISYDDDIDHAMAVIRQVLDGMEEVHKEPEPQIAVRGLGDSSVDILVRAWCDTSIYFATGLELNKRVKQAFDANGVSIPYPHQVEITKVETPDGVQPAQRLMVAAGTEQGGEDSPAEGGANPKGADPGEGQ